MGADGADAHMMTWVRICVCVGRCQLKGRAQTHTFRCDASQRPISLDVVLYLALFIPLAPLTLRARTNTGKPLGKVMA